MGICFSSDSSPTSPTTATAQERLLPADEAFSRLPTSDAVAARTGKLSRYSEKAVVEPSAHTKHSEALAYYTSKAQGKNSPPSSLPDVPLLAHGSTLHDVAKEVASCREDYLGCMNDVRALQKALASTSFKRSEELGRSNSGTVTSPTAFVINPLQEEKELSTVEDVAGELASIAALLRGEVAVLRSSGYGLKKPTLAPKKAIEESPVVQCAEVPPTHATTGATTTSKQSVGGSEENGQTGHPMATPVGLMRPVPMNPSTLTAQDISRSKTAKLVSFFEEPSSNTAGDVGAKKAVSVMSSIVQMNPCSEVGKLASKDLEDESRVDSSIISTQRLSFDDFNEQW